MAFPSIVLQRRKQATHHSEQHQLLQSITFFAPKATPPSKTISGVFTKILKMSFKSSDIDYLFEDLPAPSSTAVIFANLPGELRNNIYEHYFEDYLRSSNKAHEKTSTVEINERGEFVFAPITKASRQLCYETMGYVSEALKKPDTRICAQISEFNPKPLLATLQRVAAEINVPYRDLISRVKVTFIGKHNFSNLYTWVCENANDPNAMPLFAHEKGTIEGYGELSVFQGSMSLASYMNTYQRFEALTTNNVAWRKLALTFLDNAENYFPDSSPRLRNPTNEDIAQAVFKTVAHFHYTIAHGQHQKASPRRSLTGEKRKKDPHEQLFGMAELMNAFEVESSRALGYYEYRRYVLGL